MGTNRRFHSTCGSKIEETNSYLDKSVSAGAITEQERQIIDEYIEELCATTQISPTRRYKIAGTIVRTHAYFPEFSACTLSDVYKAIETIKTATKEDGKPRFTKNTISDYVRMVKRLFIWLCENGYSQIDIKKLEKIKVPHYDRSSVTSEGLLTEEEVEAIIRACTNSRDRALISMLYEGGFRIGEIGNLTWGDLNFTDTNVTARTSEKTGKTRFVPLFMSREYICQWRDNYPLPITPEAFVFLTTTTKKPLQYKGILKQIRLLATRAGITKHVKPHLFRHSRITHLCRQGLSESAIKMMMWGDVSTNMLRTYLHLTSDDVAAQVAELNGVELPEKNEKKRERGLKPIQCPRCACMNSPTSKYCSTCGFALTLESKENVSNMEDAIREAMANNPFIMQEIIAAMQKR